MWGHDASRNMVSGEAHLPSTFEPGKAKDDGSIDPATVSRNVRWVVKLGTQTYGNPTAAGGRVFVGTNNAGPHFRADLGGDYGVLLCVDERTGKQLWTLLCPKLASAKVSDWEQVGLCCSATVDGDHVYVVTNRCEVLCLDVRGLGPENRGAFKDEGQYIAGPNQPAVKVGAGDADIIWQYDMRDELGVYAYQQFASTILMVGDKLFVSTCNSRDWAGHIPAPNAPVLICLDANTGKLLGQEASGISSRTFVSNWSSPAYGEVGGQQMVVFGAGDGWCYGFDANPEAGVLKELWRFDANPPGRRVKDGKPTKYGSDNGPVEVLATPVFHEGKVYVSIGKNPDDGPAPGCLSCIDASKRGDITQSGKVWQFTKMSTSSSSSAIVGDLLFTADGEGFV